MCTRICALIAHAGSDFEVTSYPAALELDCTYILSIRIEIPIKVDTYISINIGMSTLIGIYELKTVYANLIDKIQI